MNTLLVATIGFAVSQLLLTLALLLLTGLRTLPQRLLFTLLLTVAAYLLLPVTDGFGRTVLGWIATAIPGLFWLLCCSFFDDDFSLAPHHWGVLALTVVPPMIGYAVPSNALDWLWYTLPQLLEFVLLLLALLAVARHWQADLVESRRRLRLWFCGLSGIYMLLLIFTREVIFPDAASRGAEYLALAAMLIIVNLLLLQVRPSLADDNCLPPAVAAEPVSPSRPTVRSADDQVLIQQLQQWVVEQARYRETGLTIGQLARELAVPEYKVRRAINLGLGYRNFNAYLNHYRVAEAARRLASAAEQAQILAIALDVGFHSLSAFNKAFKSRYGLTPSEFRKNPQNR